MEMREAAAFERDFISEEKVPLMSENIHGKKYYDELNVYSILRESSINFLHTPIPVVVCILVVLILVNIISWSGRYVYSIPTTPVDEYAINLVTLLDVLVFIYVAVSIIIRGIYLFVEFLSRRFSYFKIALFFSSPYELTVKAILTSGIGLAIYPVMIDYVFPEAPLSDSMLNFLWAFLDISVIAFFKGFAVQMIESYLYKDIRSKIYTSTKNEHVVATLEAPVADHIKDLISIQMARYRISDFFSGGMRRINNKISENFDLKALEIASNELAVQIVLRFSTGGKSYIDPSDFANIRLPEKFDYVWKLFSDKDRNVITVQSLSKGLIKIYMERRMVLNEMLSRRTIVDASSFLLNILMILIDVLVVFISFQIDYLPLLTPIFTGFLALGFAYAPILQEFCNSLYMIYIQKPFSIGDLVIINDSSPLLVLSIGILSSEFEHPDGFHIYYRNQTIVMQKITNFNRGNRLNIEISFKVPLKTHKKIIESLKEKLVDYFHSNEDWKGEFHLNAAKIDSGSDMLEYSLRAQVNIAGVWQNTRKWVPLKSQLLTFVVDALENVNEDKIPNQGRKASKDEPHLVEMI